jgi:hypothetical protein
MWKISLKGMKICPANASAISHTASVLVFLTYSNFFGILVQSPSNSVSISFNIIASSIPILHPYPKIGLIA